MYNSANLESLSFYSLSDNELLYVDGGAKEDRKFGELVGNAFAYAVAECIKIPYVSGQIKTNAAVNIAKWYLN